MNKIVSYQTQEESIRKRPENLVASNVLLNEERLITTSDFQGLVNETFTCTHLFHQIFLEILSNAIDNFERSKVAKIDPGIIKVTINQQTNEISVYNEGLAFSCEYLKDKDIYNPSAALFNLLTSTNYDMDDTSRITIGRNGYGASVCSLFTSITTIHIFNAISKIEFKQSSYNCLTKLDEPIIMKYEGNKSYFTFTYIPDFKSVFPKSNITSISNQMVQWLAKSCLEASASSNVPIYFNSDNIKYEFNIIKPFFDLILNAYINIENISQFVEFNNKEFETKIVIYDTPHYGISHGYVNGIHNPKGGSHIDFIASHIMKIIKPLLQQKQGSRGITITTLLKHISIFVTCNIPSVNISFDGQRKEKLIASKYKITFTDKDNNYILDQMKEWQAIDVINQISSNKLYKEIDGKKIYFINVKNYFGAKNAGSKKDSYKCVLNIVEGDSTINSVVKGIDSDWEGIFAVGGKILNTSKCNNDEQSDDEVLAKKVASKKIGDLIKIMGLKMDTDYSIDKNMEGLRYGKIRLLTDEDVDGYHIQGLIFNMMRDMFPSLFRMKDFIIVGNTPLIRLNNVKKEFKDKSFYSIGEYETWRDSNPNVKHSIKYLKGLGSNNDQDITHAFKVMKNKHYKYDEMADNFMALAFDAGHEDNRKTWISSYDKEKYASKIDASSISGFVNNTLMMYNLELVMRCIPSITDGLKPSQRKILYTAMSLPASTTYISSLSFIGNVMESTHYHHGDSSLYMAIAGMISSYNGYNNYALISGDGQFGTIANSSPSASRYTSCGNSSNNSNFFVDDDNILIEYNYDGLIQIEPKYYIPIVPIFLLNGGVGIAIGWSTDYCPHHIDNIINWIKVFLIKKNNPTVDINYPVLKPWFKDYQGDVKQDSNGNWFTEGKFLYNKLQETTIVTKFPVGITCESYGRKLDKKIITYANNKKKLEYKRSVKKNEEKDGTITITPYFIIHGFESPSLITLGLRSRVPDTNIKLLDESNRVLSFESTADALFYWCNFRYKMYEKRKVLQIESISKQLQEYELKVKFITDILDNKIDISKFKSMSLVEIKSLLESLGYPVEFIEIKMSSMNIESLNRLNEKIKQIKTKLNYYKDNNVTKIWMDDIINIKL